LDRRVDFCKFLIRLNGSVIYHAFLTEGTHARQAGSGPKDSTISPASVTTGPLPRLRNGVYLVWASTLVLGSAMATLDTAIAPSPFPYNPGGSVIRNESRAAITSYQPDSAGRPSRQFHIGSRAFASPNAVPRTIWAAFSRPT
jgi:hypothetical protein